MVGHVFDEYTLGCILPVDECQREEKKIDFYLHGTLDAL